MERHYNAFISYRHHPDDIRVASEIHRSLERFHVPPSIRKKHGQIKRLFRDKEELPITSDLNDDIDEALRNSDYLIVICSVHLKESIWCQREIERFLQTHPRNRVLTVLASGEPYDVIPDILLHEDVVDPVTGETRRIDIEPLSCDWRSKHRKTRQEELLRLAAPLLGCAYDELRQRQKQYKARRNAAIISTSLAASFSLTAYFLYTSITIQRANVRIQAQNEEIQAQNEEIKEANIQIKANLDEALTNQSMHLATAAQERLLEGDRLTAISLAAAALPSKDNVRPYVPEAERVLVEALGVYSPAGEMKAAGTVTPSAGVEVVSFCVSDSEKTLYLQDRRNIITTWDTGTLQKLGEIILTNYPDEMISMNSENLLVHNGLGTYTVACYQPDGTLLWQMDGCPDMTYLPEQDLLLVIHKNDSGVYELLRLDGTTGETVGQSWDLTLEDPAAWASQIETTYNGDVALIGYQAGFGAQAPYYAVDLHTGEKWQIALPKPASCAVITQEGNLVVMCVGDGTGLAGVVEGDRITSPSTRKIYCYDLYTGSLLWENAIAAPTGSLSGGMFVFPDTGNLLCVCSNILMIIDSQTGETITHCGAGSAVAAVKIEENDVTMLLKDGYISYYRYDQDCCYEVKTMVDNVQQAVMMENCYSLHLQKDHVTVYRNMTGKPAWESPVEGGFSVNNCKVWGSLLAFQDSRNQYLFDLEQKTFLCIQEKGQKDLLGFSADGRKLWYAEGTKAVTEMDIATGSCSTRELGLPEEERVSLYEKFAFFGECLYYTVRSAEGPKLVCWNLNTNEKTSCILQVETEEDITGWYWDILQAKGDRVWLQGHGKMMLEADLPTGKAQIILPESIRWSAVDAKREIVAFSQENKIYLKAPGKAEMTVIELDNTRASSMCFRDGVLFALCNNACVYRFAPSGNLLSQTELQVDSQFSYYISRSDADASKLSWHFTEDNTLVVNALGTGSVIDCENWTVKAAVSNFLLYDEKSNCLVCKVGSALAGYTLYDTAELLALAQEDLNGFQLTQEQKASYGID